VESWECDHNKHWNARYFARSFQMAAETVAAIGGCDNRGLGLIETRHLRYHRELFVGAAVEVRSVRISEGEHAGAVAHLLSCEGLLAATALDLPGTGAQGLPAVSPDQVVVAFPRGLVGGTIDEWNGSSPGDFIAETGPVRPTDIDHTGALLFEEIIRRVAFASHIQLAKLGLSADYTNETGIGRMAVESRVRPSGVCKPGALLRAKSRIVSFATKSFATNHRLETHVGELMALVDLQVVTVDLATRKAVAVPNFLQILHR